MAAPTHSYRPNIFVPERTFRLEDGALAWSDGRVAGRLKLAEIARLRVYAMPASLVPGLRRCIVRRKGGGKVVIGSTHYLHLGVTEDRAATWAPFVRALIERTAAANPAVILVSGQAWAMWAMWVLLTVGSLLVLAGMLAVLVEGEFPLGALVSVAVVAAFLPLCWRMVARGRPRTVDPRTADLPELRV